MVKARNKKIAKSPTKKDEQEPELEFVESIDDSIIDVKRERHNYSYKYREKWECHPVFGKWISPVTDDEARVYCNYCRRNVRAHRGDLLRHSKTSKHLKHERRFNSGDSFPVRFTEKKSLKGSKKKLSTMLKEETDPLEQTTVIATGNNNNNSIQVTFPNWFTDPMSSSNTQTPVDPDIIAGLPDVAKEISSILRVEVLQLLHSQPKLVQTFRESSLDGITITEENLGKLAHVCVGHLAHKYIAEPAIESVTPNTVSKNIVLQRRVKAIEKQLQDTVNEMKFLKKNFDPTIGDDDDSISITLPHIAGEVSCTTSEPTQVAISMPNVAQLFN